MSVIAKFKVMSIEKREHWVKDAGFLSTIKMSPVYDSNPDSDNARFFAATPSGTIELGTVNPEAADQFKIGKDYLITFEESL
jgi:hypothetical protein